MSARARIAVIRPERAERARRVPLPHAAAMTARFGARAAHVPVYAGPQVAEVLRKRGARAAALDGAIFLPQPSADADMVAHELVHALQQPPRMEISVDAMMTALAAAPIAPLEGAAEREARALDGGSLTAVPQHALPPGVAALRRMEPAPAEAGAPAPSSSLGQPERQAALPAPVAAPAELSTPAASADAGAAPAVEIAPTFTPPPLPETALDPAQQAAREAAGAEAQAALAAAASPGAVMGAYAAMPPSLQARAGATLGTRLQEATSASTEQLAGTTPTLTARMGGAAVGNLPPPPPIAVPGDAAALTRAAPAAPALIVPDAPAQPAIGPDPDYGRQIEQRFANTAEPEAVGEAIDTINTRNPGIVTRVDARADVPAAGAADPQRIDAETQVRDEEARQARRQAAARVVAGPGPEQVQLRAVEHTPTVEAPAAPVVEPLAAAPEMQQLDALALPPEVVAGFDTATAAQMQTGAAQARDQMLTAETDRDAARATAVDTAQRDRAAAEQQADADQRHEVGERRTAIQGERQRAVDAQQAALGEMQAEAGARRAEHRADADAQIGRDRAAIDQTYDDAERDAAAEVARGERDAEAEQRRAQRESAEQNWWDRAVSFIRRAFEALAGAINAIFDAVRAAVGTIIEAARRAVTTLIAAAARALQELISAFGALLKGLIDTLLGEIFPALAAALNRFIDDAVALANAAIGAIAEALIAAVNAIASALTTAINALLDAWRNALNAAVAFAQAVISGDWSNLLRQVLEAVLSLLGIDPAAFYALIGQATDAISIIVNDPGTFVGNLMEAVLGGIRQFAEPDRFLGHLRRGIIGWLTGALGDIQLPDEWNLWTVLDLVRQILGLTWDFLRERAARVIGPENVARLEAAFSWIATLVTEGWAGLWRRVQEQLDSLKDTVLQAIRSFLIERVVLAAISWLAGLFNPVGAIVKLVMTIWNIYQFLVNQMQRLWGIAQAVVGAISQIAHSVLAPAMARVEEILANLLPVVIDLLMSLLGVTGVAARVRQIIQNVRQAIAQAVDRLIQRTLGALGIGPGAARGAAGAGAPGAAGADAAGQIGHPVRIDVREGEDHTLSVERSGAGGATVMLRSDPLPLDTWLTRLEGMANRTRDETKKRTALADIQTARGLLRQLDPAADRAAATSEATRPAGPAAPRAAAARPARTGAAAASAGSETAGSNAEVARLEDQLGPVLTRLFDTLAEARSAFVDLYRTQIDAAHPQAQTMLRQELVAHAAEWGQLANWEAVVAAMKRASPLFIDPLDSARTFGGLARTALLAVIDGDEAKKARAATIVRQKVREGGAAEYVTLRDALHRSLLDAETGMPTEALRAAGVKAVEEIDASGDVDPALRAAVGSDLEAFLLRMARGETVGEVTPQRFDELWKAPGGANKEFIASRFRSPQGLHEWIPTNFIPQVLERARRSVEEEGIEYAALWVRVHDVWRTDTEVLIFRPETGWKRDITVSASPEPGLPASLQRVSVLQGHVGAIYARADDAGLADRPQQQTIGQGPWHDRLRDIFIAGAAPAGESRASLRTIIGNISRYADETLWRGDSPVQGLQENIFDEYYDSTRARRIGVAGVRSLALRSSTDLARDFQAALGVVG